MGDRMIEIEEFVIDFWVEQLVRGQVGDVGGIFYCVGILRGSGLSAFLLYLAILLSVVWADIT